MLKQNNNVLIATAAADLLERKTGTAISRGKAFELLENMLFIKQTPLFHTISADKLLRLVEIARLVVFQKEEVVSSEGRVANQLYIVRSGSMRVEKKSEGRRHLVAMVRKGETYGEVGLFSRAVRETSAIAQERSEIYIIKGSDIRRLVNETPEVALYLLEVISKRLFQSGKMVEKPRRASIVDYGTTAEFHNQ